LTHRRPRTSIHDVERLLDLRHAFGIRRCAQRSSTAEQAFGYEYIPHLPGATVPPLPFDETAGPSAANRKGTVTCRPGPGGRRRPQGRRAATGPDAAEHGRCILAARRTTVVIAPTRIDALFKRLHLANARRVWRDLIDRAEL